MIDHFRGFLALFRKDAREALATTLVLLPTTAVFSVLIGVAASRMRLHTAALAALRPLAVLVIPSGAFALSHAVVTREFTGKTQLFLEALPIRRFWIFVAKLSVVLAGVTGLSLAIGAGSLALPVGQGLTAGMLLRLVTFGWFCGSCFFLAGFLGRYRIPLLFAVLVIVGMVSDSKEIRLSRVGPIALANETLFVDRHAIPWRDMGWSMAATALLVTAAAFLALVREADLPARLAERMSQREKAFMGGAVVALVVTAAELDSRKTKPAYVLPQAAFRSSDGISVAVGSGVARSDAADEELANYLHEGLAYAHSVVELPFSRLIVVSSSDLPEGVVESGAMDSADGLLFRTLPSASLATRENLLDRAVRAVVGKATHGRALLEPRAFILDGFGMYIARRSHLKAPLENDDDLWLKALISAPEGPSGARIQSWFTFREQAGAEGARAVAFTGLRVLAATVGVTSANAFLHGALGFRTSDDVRALWQTPGVDRILATTCGLTRDSWIDIWRRAYADAGARLRPQLTEAPRPEGSLQFERLGPRTSRARVTLNADGRLHDGDRVELQTVTLAISRDALDEDDARREEMSVAALKRGATLPYTYGRGDRFAWRLVAIAADGVRVPSPWHRGEAP
jgi:hypothetical protein